MFRRTGPPIRDRHKHRQINIGLELSGVEKLTWSSLKGVSNRALFCLKNGHFASRFLLLGRAFLEASKRQIVFQKSLSETPFKPDRVSFALPKLVLL